jgi:hypothetical protein
MPNCFSGSMTTVAIAAASAVILGPILSTRITSEQSNETLHLSLGIADEACADLII